MLRSVILAAAGSDRVKRLVETTAVSRAVVARFVAGTTGADALRVSQTLIGEGASVSLDHLGEDTTTAEQADATRDEYLALLTALGDAGLTAGADSGDAGPGAASSIAPRKPDVEVSVKLSALGQRFDEAGAFARAHAICAAAARVGTTVTVDMEDHTTTDSTLSTVVRLRSDFPGTGAVLQAYLRRTEGDCRELVGAGSRVRLCKGAYREPESVAFPARIDVDKSYVRCLNILMSGDGYPMVATHDPRLISIAEDRARWFDRTPASYEFQLLHGVRPLERARLVADGFGVRVYVPYGGQWYGYLMRRLAERPANMAFFARSLASRQ
jgi:proline dehydrogenase